MRLEVYTDFPGGNAAAVSLVEDEGHKRVLFSADPQGGPEALWFYLRVSRAVRPAGETGELELVLCGHENMLGCGRPRFLQPVVRGPDFDWRRLPAPEERDLGDGRRQLVWTADELERFLDVALSYPYTSLDLDRLVEETGEFYSASSIGVSQAGRELVRLASSPGEPGSERPGLYIIARQHSGEAPGSWVLDGLLRRLAGMGEDAPLVWAVPLANVDGVEEGAYGKDNFPYDLNRAWGTPPMRHETLVIGRDLARWRERCRPALALDLHAPGGTEADGIYAYLPEAGCPADLQEPASRAADELEAALGPELAAADFSRRADYPSRWETPNFTAFCTGEQGVAALALETPYALSAGGEVVLTRERYREAGARMADALARLLS